MQKTKSILGMISRGVKPNIACSLGTQFEDQFKRKLKSRFGLELDHAVEAYVESERLQTVQFSDVEFTPGDHSDVRFNILRLSVCLKLQKEIPNTDLVAGAYNGMFALLYVEDNKVYY